MTIPANIKGLKSNPELLKLLMDIPALGGMNMSTLDSLLAPSGGVKYGLDPVKIGPGGVPEPASFTLDKLNEALKKATAPKTPDIKPLSAEDFSCNLEPNSPYKMGIGPDDAAKALRYMADLVEQGLYQIKSVAAASEATGDEFPTHSLVINYSLFHKKD